MAKQYRSTRLNLQRAGSMICLWVSLTAAAPGPKNILFLGDSITAGYGLEPAQSYPALIQEKIEAKKWPFRTVNAGQSGDTSAGGLNRMDWLLRSRVDVLILELGGNDGLRGLPPDQRRAWRHIFDYYVFDQQEDATAHIPEAARGILAPMNDTVARMVRADLLNQLNR